MLTRSILVIGLQILTFEPTRAEEVLKPLSTVEKKSFRGKILALKIIAVILNPSNFNSQE